MKSLLTTFGTLLLGLMLALAAPPPAEAEYGDVVINNFSDAAGMRPVVFPHWFHRVRFRCKVCHADLGFQFKAGGNRIDMLKIIDGQFCGSCHNGELAWSVENCNLCHSGKPGTPTQVHESTLQKLNPATAAAPVRAASAPPSATTAATATATPTPAPTAPRTATTNATTGAAAAATPAASSPAR